MRDSPPSDTPRFAPAQAGGTMPHGRVPWHVHLAAWNGYAAAGHGGQSAERIAERGGFSYREIQCAIEGHYNDCFGCKEDHPPVPEWEV